MASGVLVARPMLTRHTLRLNLALVIALSTLSGCSASHTDETPGPDGGLGPYDASLLAHPDGGLGPYDAGPVTIVPDGGLGPYDAGPPVTTDCEGLAPAACLAAGCVPDFDDACCSYCAPGACADCTNIGYESCQPPERACTDELSCGMAPSWACEPVAPSCAGASVVDFDSCTRTGCVPAYPSSEGEPDPSLASCVPITAVSCTVACRIVAPPCPTGTTAEGDGSCYTSRCIPSFVCE